jgi:hypothetical protein
MTKSEILQAIAHTNSDDFTESGKSLGCEDHAAIIALCASNDRLLVLRALQIAFALGVKSNASTQAKRADEAVHTIKRHIESL